MDIWLFDLFENCVWLFNNYLKVIICNYSISTIFSYLISSILKKLWLFANILIICIILFISIFLSILIIWYYTLSLWILSLSEYVEVSMFFMNSRFMSRSVGFTVVSWAGLLVSHWATRQFAHSLNVITSLGAPIACLASCSTRNRRAARPLQVLCHSNTLGFSMITLIILIIFFILFFIWLV